MNHYNLKPCTFCGKPTNRLQTITEDAGRSELWLSVCHDCVDEHQEWEDYGEVEWARYLEEQGVEIQK